MNRRPAAFQVCWVAFGNSILSILKRLLTIDDVPAADLIRLALVTLRRFHARGFNRDRNPDSLCVFRARRIGFTGKHSMGVTRRWRR